MENYKREFDHYLAGIAWGAWKELGVASTDRFSENCLIQLEELIILTSMISKYDPRLRDEALDWCSRYHEYISVSRLRTLLNELNEEVKTNFSQFAASLNAVSSTKWPIFDNKTPFKTKLSGKSVLPSLESPSLLALRLRSLFGPGTKADILTHFLTKNRMRLSASDLIEIGYSKRSLQTALDHLAAVSILSVTNVRNMKYYELKKPKELQVLIGKLPGTAPPWSKILQAIAAINTVLPEIQTSSETTKGVLLRNCLIEIEPLLPFFISHLIQNPQNFNQDWNALTGIFKAFQKGNFFMQYQVHDEFNKIVNRILQSLYQVDDSYDGIEKIVHESSNKEKQHEKVYKECYQLFLNFITDLQVELTQFSNLPFHQMLDETLAEISYKFSKEQLPLLTEKIKQIQLQNRIVNAQSAARQYQLFIPELDIVQQFTNTFIKQLQNLYFAQTDIHLLTAPSKLNKRHLVLDLFSNKNMSKA